MAKTEQTRDEWIKTELSQDVPAEDIKTRDSGFGGVLSYVDSYYVINTMCELFGPAAWGYDIIEMKQLTRAQVDNKWRISYSAKVRIKSGQFIATEGYGCGHGIDRDEGRAHESAIKEAETDALKRACRTLGRRMGLSLYRKDDEPKPHVHQLPPQQSAQKGSPDSSAAVMPFGKHQGKRFDEIETDYLQWFSGKLKADLADPAKEKYKNRAEAQLRAIGRVIDERENAQVPLIPPQFDESDDIPF